MAPSAVGVEDDELVVTMPVQVIARITQNTSLAEGRLLDQCHQS
jgi:hypothetical protein